MDKGKTKFLLDNDKREHFFFFCLFLGKKIEENEQGIQIKQEIN